MAADPSTRSPPPPPSLPPSFAKAAPSFPSPCLGSIPLVPVILLVLAGVDLRAFGELFLAAAATAARACVVVVIATAVVGVLLHSGNGPKGGAQKKKKSARTPTQREEIDYYAVRPEY